MANLRANKITGTEVFETTGSVQFDGNNDYLTIPDSSDFTFGSGDFTLEAWIYVQSYGNYPSIIDKYDNGGSGAQWFWSLDDNSPGQSFYFYTASDTIFLRNVGNVPLNQWTHCAVTRNGETIRIFQNGILQGSFSVGTSSMNDSSGAVSIGADALGLYDFRGHISNARILKGKALYTSNFTPPTRELTVTPETVLLACQSTTNAAREATGKTITVNGNAVANELTPGLLTDRVKSGGTSAITGSVEFDGNDYLLESTGADGFNGGLGDWTVEAWMYCTDASQSDVLINGLTSSTDRFYINFIGQTLYVGDFSINNIAIGGVKQINSWFHIAVTKSGSTYRAFINGVLIGSSTESLLNSTLTSLQIGYRGSQNYYTKGFISNLRIVKGTAVYTSNFIPPTRELKKLPGTVLLCCKNSSDPTAEETGKTITANGDPAASNFTPQVGSDGSVEFAGPTKINSENYFYLPTGNTEDRGRGRGIIAGGYTTGNVNTIEYITITSSGNGIDFGDITIARHGLAACSSTTRGVFGGGASPSFVNTIDYITISSTANAIDFGDLLATTHTLSACSSQTRGIFAGGLTPSTINTIQYITIASLGNTVSFGTLTQTRHGLAACSSRTRGVFGGGTNPSPIFNTIDYITIASTGNAVDFGDLNQTVVFNANSSCSSSVRGLWGGGETPTNINVIDYITIASTGNATDFGDLTGAKRGVTACSSTSRGIFGGGETPTNLNTIDYVTISTTGNAQDFGDLTVAKTQPSACSDSHGGLG